MRIGQQAGLAQPSTDPKGTPNPEGHKAAGSDGLPPGGEALLNKVMEDLDYFSKRAKRDKIHGPVESDPEYQCIVEANNLMVEIDNEINIIHKYVRDLYSKRFPELESLVLTCLDYLKTVLVLGNDILERSKQTDLLSPFLTPATIMVVSVTASTTQGSPLKPDQLARIEEACQMAIELHDMRVTMLTYVESRMSFIAPNISILVGASTAAKLMGTFRIR
ncbi:unnamed protein product [Echinostoma caproni]|uniref:NOSIC domain-containing protein n=1 Tax=Echinostoma caproni TaxID=27848 RepID=A0A183AKS3_9TREM|nr:unnamed protein product [Echinostoma caproni]